VPVGAPAGYGLIKWPLVIHSPGSNVYYTVARRQVGDPGRFLAGYLDWIRRQDAVHTGTHPPGLFLIEHLVMWTMEAQPGSIRPGSHPGVDRAGLRPGPSRGPGDVRRPGHPHPERPEFGKVGRIWLPFMPPLPTASGLGLTRLGGGPKTLAATLALLGAETLALQATIRVVVLV
jgi:hypothetical protein